MDTNDEIQEWVGTHTNITEQQAALRDRNFAQQVNQELEIKVQARTAELQKGTG